MSDGTPESNEPATPPNEPTKPASPLKEVEDARISQSILRIIREHGGLSAKDIGQRLPGEGLRPRAVRAHIHWLRANGEAITIGQPNGNGYYHMDCLDETTRAVFVKGHRERTRSYLIDHATLARQIGKMTAMQIAQFTLFDILIPDEPGAAGGGRVSTMADLAQIPAARRAGVTRLLMSLLEGLEKDPEAFAYERAALADRFHGMFLTKVEAGKLAQARKLLEEVGV